MSRFKPFLTGTSTLIALSMLAGTVAPMMMSAPASAGLFPSQPTYPSRSQPNPNNTQYGATIPYGTSIPVVYDQAQKIVISPTESVDLTLTVPANIRSRSGDLLIPRGSQIVGKLQPANVGAGSQFVANQLIISDTYGRRSISIDAASDAITQTQEITKGSDTGGLLKGAAVGAAAAAGISAVTGNRQISAIKVLGGAALGTLSQVFLGHKSVSVVSINPNTDLNLTLRSDLALR